MFTPVGPRLSLHQDPRKAYKAHCWALPAFRGQQEWSWENGFLLSGEDALVWPGTALGERVVRTLLTAHRAETTPSPQGAWLQGHSSWTGLGGCAFIRLWTFLLQIHDYTRDGVSGPGS